MWAPYTLRKKANYIHYFPRVPKYADEFSTLMRNKLNNILGMKIDRPSTFFSDSELVKYLREGRSEFWKDFKARRPAQTAVKQSSKVPYESTRIIGGTAQTLPNHVWDEFDSRLAGYIYESPELQESIATQVLSEVKKEMEKKRMAKKKQGGKPNYLNPF